MEMFATLLVNPQLTWRGGIVLILLCLPILLAQFLRRFPRDLAFTLAALLTGLLGIISSAQLFESAFNQTIFAVLGLWLIGKAMQQQGIFHAIASGFLPVKKNRPWKYFWFFLETIAFGAFLHHRYFPSTVLRSLVRQAEKVKGDLKIYGFPFAYLFLIGGLATTIGVPINLLFLTLYTSLSKDVPSSLFAFFPFALLPILLSLFLFLLFKSLFRKPFSQFIDAGTCVTVPADSLLIGKAASSTTIREGKSISKATFLQSGDLLVFAHAPTSRTPIAQLIPFVNTVLSGIRWKKITIVLCFLGAIGSTFIGVAIGTAFLAFGLLLLCIHPFPLKAAFQEEFPFPLLLEIFSGFLFFFAMQTSGLDLWLSSYLPFHSPFALLPLFFILTQIAAHLMPRPIAFTVLFSIAHALFQAHLAQLLIIGINIAFAAAIPLFGKPQVDEMAISTAINGRAPLAFRALLIFILFGSTVIPSCFFWP